MEYIHLNVLRIRWAILAALALALPQVLILQLQLISTTDLPLHLDRMVAMSMEFENGYLWPRWSHYLHNGFGFPIFNYYAPGTYYLGAIIHALTSLGHDVILFGFIIAILIMRPVGAYLFARSFTTTPAALFAAAVYTLTPMHFRELLVQGNMPQFATIALLPFILWAFAQAIRSQRLGWHLAGAALFALAILFHHLTAFLFAPVLVFYCLILALTLAGTRRSKLIRLTYAALAIILSLGLAAIYWIPTLTELHYTQINSQQDASFQIEENFILAENLLALTESIDRSWLNWDSHYGTFGPRLGLGHFIVLLAGLVSVLRPSSKSQRLLVLCCAVSSLLLLFMITPSAEPIWKIIPLIDYIQFPWRLLIIVAVLLIPVAANILQLIPVRWQNIGALALITALFLVMLPMFYAPIEYLPQGPYTPITALEDESETGNMGTTASGEYLPAWVQQTPFRVLTEFELDFLTQERWRVWIEEGQLPPDVSIQYDEASPIGSSQYHIQAANAFTLHFNQFYFPGWILERNGQPYPLTPSDPEGLLEVTLPAGESTLRLYYGGTETQHLATLISLISLGLWGGGLALALWKQARNPVPLPRPEQSATKLSLALIALIGVLTLANTAIIQPHTDWFRPQNGVENPPAQQRVSVPFGDLVELIGYDINQDRFNLGDQVHVRLYWRLLNPGPRMLRSSVHLTGKDGRDNRGGHNAYHIGAIPFYRWNTSQYVTDDHFFTVNEDAAPFTTEIRVAVFDAAENYFETPEGLTSIPLKTVALNGDWQQIDADTFRPYAVDFGGMIQLEGYALEGPTPESPDQYCLNLRWRAQQTISQNYTVMLHIVSPEGDLIQAMDSPPLDGLYPTHDWQIGQVLDDRHCLQNTDSANQLWLGLYDAKSLTRLSVTNAPHTDNALTFSLNTLEITPEADLP